MSQLNPDCPYHVRPHPDERCTCVPSATHRSAIMHNYCEQPDPECPEVVCTLFVGHAELGQDHVGGGRRWPVPR